MRGRVVLRLVWIGWLGLAASSARAEVKLNALFADNMVLQQGRDVPVWGTAAADEKVTVRFLGYQATVTPKDGHWTVWFPPLRAGGPYEMTIAGGNTITIKNILIGEVWVCSGQSNMQMGLSGCLDGQKAIAESADPQLRLFTVRNVHSDTPRSEVTVGQSWVEAGPQSVGGFSGVGYYFGKHLRKALGVPVGLIHSSWGGTPAEAWTTSRMLNSRRELQPVLDRYLSALKAWPENKRKWQEALAAWTAERDAAKSENKPFDKRAPGIPYGPLHNHRPSCLYNAMIAPLAPYAIQGAIWYQGESNAGRAYEYRELMPAMIQSWRDAWGQGDFTFLIVQLAPFMKIEPNPTESAWAELREAQLMSTRALPKVGMAVITDVGEEADIHPKNKEPVGARLAIAAEGIAYGRRSEYTGPVFRSIYIDRTRIRVHFGNVGTGLQQKGEKLTGFAICGADRKFHNAEARIAGPRTVEVWSPEVPEPVAVRFGWANFPVVNLYDSEGLPASPFRSDDYPGVTAPKPSLPR